MHREDDSNEPEILDPHELTMIEIKKGFIIAIVILLIIIVSLAFHFPLLKLMKNLLIL